MNCGGAVLTSVDMHYGHLQSVSAIVIVFFDLDLESNMQSHFTKRIQIENQHHPIPFAPELVSGLRDIQDSSCI